MATTPPKRPRIGRGSGAFRALIMTHFVAVCWPWLAALLPAWVKGSSGSASAGGEAAAVSKSTAITSADHRSPRPADPHSPRPLQQESSPSLLPPSAAPTGSAAAAAAAAPVTTGGVPTTVVEATEKAAPTAVLTDKRSEKEIQRDAAALADPPAHPMAAVVRADPLLTPPLLTRLAGLCLPFVGSTQQHNDTAKAKKCRGETALRSEAEEVMDLRKREKDGGASAAPSSSLITTRYALLPTAGAVSSAHTDGAGSGLTPPALPSPLPLRQLLCGGGGLTTTFDTIVPRRRVAKKREPSVGAGEGSAEGEGGKVSELTTDVNSDGKRIQKRSAAEVVGALVSRSVLNLAGSLSRQLPLRRQLAEGLGVGGLPFSLSSSSSSSSSPLLPAPSSLIDHSRPLYITVPLRYIDGSFELGLEATAFPLLLFFNNNTTKKNEDGGKGKKEKGGAGDNTSQQKGSSSSSASEFSSLQILSDLITMDVGLDLRGIALSADVELRIRILPEGAAQLAAQLARAPCGGYPSLPHAPPHSRGARGGVGGRKQQQRHQYPPPIGLTNRLQGLISDHRRAKAAAAAGPNALSSGVSAGGPVYIPPPSLLPLSLVGASATSGAPAVSRSSLLLRPVTVGAGVGMGMGAAAASARAANFIAAASLTASGAGGGIAAAPHPAPPSSPSGTGALPISSSSSSPPSAANLHISPSSPAFGVGAVPAAAVASSATFSAAANNNNVSEDVPSLPSHHAKAQEGLEAYVLSLVKTFGFDHRLFAIDVTCRTRPSISVGISATVGGSQPLKRFVAPPASEVNTTDGLKQQYHSPHHTDADGAGGDVVGNGGGAVVGKEKMAAAVGAADDDCGEEAPHSRSGGGPPLPPMATPTLTARSLAANASSLTHQQQQQQQQRHQRDAAMQRSRSAAVGGVAAKDTPAAAKSSRGRSLPPPLNGSSDLRKSLRRDDKSGGGGGIRVAYPSAAPIAEAAAASAAQSKIAELAALAMNRALAKAIAYPNAIQLCVGRRAAAAAAFPLAGDGEGQHSGAAEGGGGLGGSGEAPPNSSSAAATNTGGAPPVSSSAASPSPSPSPSPRAVVAPMKVGVVMRKVRLDSW